MSTVTVSSSNSSHPNKSSYCVAPPRNNFRPLCKKADSSLKKSTPKYLPLRNVLPATFQDMYTPEVLSSTALTSEGRPTFTQRDIVDWKKNDIRSLLILGAPLPEWKSAKTVPQIIEPGYRIQILPYDASDSEIISILVASDLYKEHGFETQFLIQTAEYTVQAARERQARVDSKHNKNQHKNQHIHPRPFTKPEWRNIIENYLLNLACEAQCRADFQQMCSYMKRQKLMSAEQQASFNDTHPDTHKALDEEINRKLNSRSSPKSCSPLLKKALLTSISTFPKNNSSSNTASPSTPKVKVSLTRLEKQQIWVNVQSELYKRLGLNWQPDELV